MRDARTRHEGLHESIAEGLARGLTMTLRARGASMRPAIRDGEEVRLRPLGNNFPAIGEIVLARTPGGAALHRVIAVDQRAGRALLKGDALRSADAPLPLAHILGRAEAVRRTRGWVRLDTPWRRRMGRFLSIYLSPRAPLRYLARRLV